MQVYESAYELGAWSFTVPTNKSHNREKRLMFDSVAKVVPGFVQCHTAQNSL